jgi:WD40 repeat protein
MVSDHIKAVAISADGRTVIGSLHGGRKEGFAARVWDVASGAEKRQIAGHVSMVTDVHFLQDGKRILTGSEDGTVRVWDVESGQELRRWHAQRKVEQIMVGQTPHPNPLPMSTWGRGDQEMD